MKFCERVEHNMRYINYKVSICIINICISMYSDKIPKLVEINFSSSKKLLSV